MSIHPQNKDEVQSAIATVHALRCDVITVPVEGARLREIVSDETADEEKRRMAYELTSARTSIGLLLAMSLGDAKTVCAAVLDVLEKNSSRCCDDAEDCAVLSVAITAALVGGGR